MPVCALNNMISVGLFTTAKLEEIDVTSLTPVEALMKLDALKRLLTRNG